MAVVRAGLFRAARVNTNLTKYCPRRLCTSAGTPASLSESRAGASGTSPSGVTGRATASGTHSCKQEWGSLQRHSMFMSKYRYLYPPPHLANVCNLTSATPCRAEDIGAGEFVPLKLPLGSLCSDGCKAKAVNAASCTSSGSACTWAPGLGQKVTLSSGSMRLWYVADTTVQISTSPESGIEVILQHKKVHFALRASADIVS